MTELITYLLNFLVFTFGTAVLTVILMNHYGGK